ncbi:MULTISPECIES: 16S rRNA (cytidine(1402)-2'-O)-methyltransferase [unclassified Imperialibacter]|uniref:16S rRNA (cytidine(1402)-2'-O)-methyltransferase n=1 Tax=unclassified Imperialibacter TaxID=2629706 RepID=UPI001258401A|nr:MULTISPECIES: 16S rRNA (cytidine(1402)-2'-O)-methyltransferase [unclassified Imperialibacter]CAD5271854.1 Ribosomal RNA small subunit methyltransferase I [Imperialibacter sp. 89]CAD5299081.1 Ribosomal RNA small subunit methyltransferase I [Imperialibacter sp. 75]VVT35137.1 Ribosomal RNA small subunit methyltransferase I [Imperialibacter sp. EC-SDR9]
MAAAKLYLVPTPIGNLEDITLRALRVLREVDVILAEDTRTSGVLLKHFEISKPVKSFHIFNEHKVVSDLVARLKAGESMALISDAGTPGISDPGYLIVREAISAGIVIDCLPGPTALIPAVVKSGFPCDRFVFEGFLPHKKGKQSKIEAIKEEERAVIYYESPHRLVKTLEMFVTLLGGDRMVSVSRELSKLYEETITGSATEVLAHFQAKPPKGEIVIVVSGK